MNTEENKTNTESEETKNEAETENRTDTILQKTKKCSVRWWILLLIALAIIIGAEAVQRIQIERAIAFAGDQLGKKYVLGAEGPNTYDCSSLVQHSLAAAHIKTPRLAVEIGYCDQYKTIETLSDLLRGDIICFDTVRDSDLSDHVGLYLGNGRMLHASSAQGKVVISALEGYYLEHFSWGKRIIPHIPLDISFLIPKTESFE